MNLTPITIPDYVEDEQDTLPLFQQSVLIADDDVYIRQFLELTLQKNGYKVISAANGYELVQLAQQHTPHIILVDLMMPEMDGYEAIGRLRNDPRTAHIPLLILTARTHIDDLVVGFETGADDYMSKPFEVTELLARIKSHLRRASRQILLNPLSGLPGGRLLAQELRYRLGLKQKFAVLYADLNNFKTFNDTYGFTQGDHAIMTVANILQRVLLEHGNPDDFIGHIGGDDFAVLTTPGRVDPICQAIIDLFDHEISKLYHPDDWARGYVSGVDRYGILRRFNLMSIAIGVVTTQRRTFAGEEDLARVAAEMKQYAKAQRGSTYAVDQRALQRAPSPEHRGNRRHTVLLASDDASLRGVLRLTLQENNYIVYEASDVETLHQLLDETAQPALVLADAHLGAPLWVLCADHDHVRQSISSTFVALVYNDEEIAQAKKVGVTAYLRQPIPLTDIIEYVEQYINQHACVPKVAAEDSIYCS